MKDLLRQMFSAANGQMSSKRVMGVLIIVTITSAYVYCAITTHPMPDGTGEMLLTSTALLGVDSVTGAFRKSQNNGQQ